MILIKRCAEYIPQKEISKVPKNIKGIYILLNHKGKNYDVAYVGMTAKCIWSRVNAHAVSKRKRKLWTHFSLFETKNEKTIKELEGIIRHIYRKDSRANKINIMVGYDALRKIRACKGRFEIEKWKKS